MATYFFPDNYIQSQVKALKRRTLYLGILGLAMLPIAFMVADRLTTDPNARFIFTAGIVVSFSYGLIVNYLGTKKSLSLKLLITEESIRAEYSDSKSIEIARSDVQEIADIEGKGLRVSSKTKKPVFLSKDLSNFDDLHQTLAKWTPIAHAKDPFLEITFILIAFGLLGLAFVMWPATLEKYFPWGFAIVAVISAFAVPIWRWLRKRSST